MTAPHRPANRAAEAAQLRTRAWVGKCLLDTGQKNLNALSLFVEPELQWVSRETGERSRTNKWRGYWDGTRSPRVALVDKVARLEVNGRTCTATRELFFHVLWSVLGTADPKPSAVAGWLKQFEPAVRRVMDGARWLPEAPSAAQVPELSLRVCRRLERLASFDALGLSTLAFLQAHKRGRLDAARSAGWCVFKLLHIMQPRLLQLGVDGPMLTFYQRWIVDCSSAETIQFLWGMTSQFGTSY